MINAMKIVASILIKEKGLFVVSTMYISESRIINGDTYLTISGSVNVSLSRIGMKQLPKSNAMTIPST